MGTDYPRDQAAPVGPEVKAWLSGAMRFVTELLAAAHRVTGVLFRGDEATLAAGDQVAVVAASASG